MNPKKFPIRLVFAALAGTFLFITLSCEKKEALSSAVELLSFGPAGIQHGEQMRIIGNNLDKVTAIEFVGASIQSTNFVEQTSELIVVTVPEQAERGIITLKTSEGDITSKSPLNLEVPVVITDFTTSAKPGEQITFQGEYLNWVTSIVFADELPVTEFVSQSLTELLVTVPMNAQSGSLTVLTGGTEPLTIELEDQLEVTLPSITGFSPNPVDRGANLTVSGADLDLVKGIVLKGVADTIMDFVSRSETELVIAIPEEATRGTLSIVAFSNIAVESEDILTFVGDPVAPDPLAYPLYIDQLENSAQNWGWGSTVDFNNSENVRDGNAAIKVSYQGSWGALKFANFSVNTAGYQEIAFSIFGTPGTGGKTINLTTNGSSAYVITITEGEWVEYKLPLTELGNPATMTELVFQETGWSGTVYMDHVGLR